MDKKRIELIIAGIGLVIFVLLVAGKAKTSKPKQEPIKQIDSTISRTERSDALFWIKKEAAEKEAGEAKELKWGRDPFTLQETVVQTVDTVTSLRLMGITAGDKARPMAVINDKIVSIGSKIGKFKVLSISKDRVIITDGNENFELQMR